MKDYYVPKSEMENILTVCRKQKENSKETKHLEDGYTGGTNLDSQNQPEKVATAI